MRIPLRFRRKFRHPWTQAARESVEFHQWLLHHGLLSPHFTIAEAGCHDGTPVPAHFIAKAQRHAFNLEQLRHRLGDRPLSILSWYRDLIYNRSVGGVSNSQHLYADATDFSQGFVESFGSGRFDREADFVFSHGGFGQYPSGSRHADSRGYRARWTSS